MAVVHSGWSQLAFGSVLRAEGVPVVRYFHGVPSQTDWRDRFAMTPRPILAICASEFIKQSADKVYADQAKSVVRCPVNFTSEKLSTDARRRLRNEMGAVDETVVITQVSRMEAWKGQRQLLRRIARVKCSSDWQVWIVGGAQRPSERAYSDELKGMARELGIQNRVRFLGERTDVKALLRASDIFCQMNEKPEPFGIVFIEALAASLPVIATRSGGAIEILDGVGRLISDNEKEWIDNLTCLIEDPILRASVGAQGPNRADELCAPIQQTRLLRSTLGAAIFGR